MITMLLLASVIPDGAVDFANDLQAIAVAIAAFTAAVIGTVTSVLVVVRKAIVGPTEARLNELVTEVKEMKEELHRQREDQEFVKFRQGLIGGALGLFKNDDYKEF